MNDKAIIQTTAAVFRGGCSLSVVVEGCMD